MTHFRLMRSSILVFAPIAVVVANAGRRTAAETTEGTPARSFEFAYQVHVPANTDAVWACTSKRGSCTDFRSLTSA